MISTDHRLIFIWKFLVLAHIIFFSIEVRLPWQQFPIKIWCRGYLVRMGNLSLSIPSKWSEIGQMVLIITLLAAFHWTKFLMVNIAFIILDLRTVIGWLVEFGAILARPKIEYKRLVKVKNFTFLTRTPRKVPQNNRMKFHSILLLALIWILLRNKHKTKAGGFWFHKPKDNKLVVKPKPEKKPRYHVTSLEKCWAVLWQSISKRLNTINNLSRARKFRSFLLLLELIVLNFFRQVKLF